MWGIINGLHSLNGFAGTSLAANPGQVDGEKESSVYTARRLITGVPVIRLKNAADLRGAGRRRR
jgi:hypothetical protein